MGRSKPISNILDVVTYMKIASKSAITWEALTALWDRACNLYYRIVTEQRTQKYGKNIACLPQIQFRRIVKVAKDLKKKLINSTFSLNHIQGKFNVNQTVKALFALVERLATERARLMQKGDPDTIARKLQSSCDKVMKKLKMISSNIDYLMMQLKVGVHSGPKGCISFSVTDIHMQVCM